MWQQGYIQLYTGNGKGKTTAALGLALRAAGAGLKTMILQFMKGQPYSELNSLKRLDDLITIEQHGSEQFCRPDADSFAEHYQLTRVGLARARQVLAQPDYSVVILDELVTCLLFRLVTIEEIRSLIQIKQPRQELVLTGRGATPELIGMCDLVTEMIEVKHYYTKGVQARPGIES